MPIVDPSRKIQEIPLVPATSQIFGIVLKNNPYQMTVSWRDVNNDTVGDQSGLVGGGWVLDIADQTGAPIASGIPLVTGADLLAQLTYLGIDTQLVVQTSHDVDAVPTFENLGDTSHLYAALPRG